MAASVSDLDPLRKERIDFSPLSFGTIDKAGREREREKDVRKFGCNGGNGETFRHLR